MATKEKLFIRVPCRSKTEPLSKARKARTYPRRPSKRKPKPPWDSTVTDLTAYKASPDELARKHELCKPKLDHERKFWPPHQQLSFIEEKENLDLTAAMEHSLKKRQAVIKEVFYNQERELKDVLEETDRTIANVKDLFGDNPLKYKGLPNITVAPNQKDTDAYFHAIDPHKSSFYDQLSASIVRHPELNAVAESETSSGEEIADDENLKRAQFKPQFDLRYYEDIIKKGALDDKRERSNGSQLARASKLIDENSALLLAGAPRYSGDSTGTQDLTLKDISSISNIPQEEEFDALPPSVCENGPRSYPNARIRAKARVDVEERSAFSDLKEMLDRLEEEISAYEKETGNENIMKASQTPSSLTGYTANLLSTIVRLTHHLRQSETQLKAEMLLRQHIMDALEEQRALIDALTADLLATQATSSDMQSRVEKQSTEIQSVLAEIQEDMSSLKNRVTRLEDAARTGASAGSKALNFRAQALAQPNVI